MRRLDVRIFATVMLAGSCLTMVQGENQKLMAETQPPQLNDGLRVETDGLGSGEPAKNGMTLHIEYKGAITNGYIVFDEGKMFFPLGRGHVIKGWDQGLLGIKVGETRTLYVPSALGYGEWGTPGGPIPKNADLTYHITLTKIDPEAHIYGNAFHPPKPREPTKE